MKHDIIKTDNYLLIVSDEEMNDCWTFNLFRNQPYFLKGYYGKQPNAKKIIGHLPLNNSPILEGVDLLPPLEDEVKKLGEKCWCDNEITNIHSFVIGYNKAKEKYKYTEFDIITALEYGWNQRHFGKIDEDELRQIQKRFIQSLQQPKYPIGFECEDEVYMYSINGDIIKPKTTTNPKGQTQLIGKYIYE